MPNEAELELALESARRAGRRILEIYERFEAIPDARADISTEADKDAQELILQTLRGRFPEDAYCAEETTPTLAGCRRAGPRVWVIDPIDGTRGFAQKNGQFSVMVGLAVGERVVLGVVLEPALDRLTWAVRGGGCWRQDGEGKPVACRVSATADMARATLVQSHSKPGRPVRHVELLQPGRVAETHSAGVKLARVARGEADLYVNHYPNFHDWDIAAGHILVEEAGGRVTGLRGQSIRYGLPGADQRHGLLASNGELHGVALERLAGGM
jgi:3'(2'), 5'-bisphosphate nucleotidase